MGGEKDVAVSRGRDSVVHSVLDWGDGRSKVSRTAGRNEEPVEMWWTFCDKREGYVCQVEGTGRADGVKRDQMVWARVSSEVPACLSNLS